MIRQVAHCDFDCGEKIEYGDPDEFFDAGWLTVRTHGDEDVPCLDYCSEACLASAFTERALNVDRL